MRGAPWGGVAAEPAAVPRLLPRHALATLVPAATAFALAAAVLAGGGSDAAPLLWIGGAAFAVTGIGAAAVLAGALPRPPLGRAGLALVAALAGLAAWAGASVVWSVEPDRSWDSFNRAAVYVGLLALGILFGTLVRDAPRALAILLAAVLGVAVAWSLASAVVPALGPDVERSARLRAPVGYWNALALLVAMSLPLWLWLRRPLGAVALFGSVVALLLTASRGGILVAAVAVAAWLVLVRPRRDALWTLLVAVPPGLAVGAWALTTPVAEAGADGRARAGAWLALALALGAGLVAAAARRPAPRATVRLAAGLAVAGAVAALAVAAVEADEWWAEFRNPPAVQVPNDPSRLGAASSNHRWTWWTQAWAVFADRPLGGAGAGAYEMARRPIREDTRAPLDPHNIFLKALSETGAVGFLLLGAAVVAGGAVAAGALRRLEGEERAAAAALAAGGAAWLAHGLVDMGWEYVAVAAPVFVGLGVLAVAGRAPRAPARAGALAAAAPLAVAAALVASLAAPWLAERRMEAALDASLRGDWDAAAEAAAAARSLDPLSVRALHLEATALEASGRLAEAERRYEAAVRVAPRNPQTWYELGRFELQARGDLGEALLYLDRSWALDPWPPETGALLDEVRAEIAERGA